MAKNKATKTSKDAKEPKTPKANSITEAIVTLKRADGHTYTILLSDMGVKGKKEQYHLFAAPAGNPDISNWGGLFMHNARKS